MAPENVELMERIVQLWNAGDWDGVFAYYDDEVVFEDGLLPDGGTYTGIDAVRARVDELLDVAGTWRARTESVFDAGADVVWITRVTGRRDEDTPAFDGIVGVVFSFEGGRVVRLRWFPTPEQALEAAGLDGA
jgi:ketosteroid isomerase-like protein